MNVKRYRSGTVREALAQARAELGPNALVLSTRLVDVAGVRGLMGAREVELTASAGDGVSETRPEGLTTDIIDASGRQSSFEPRRAVAADMRRGAAATASTQTNTKAQVAANIAAAARAAADPAAGQTGAARRAALAAVAAAAASAGREQRPAHRPEASRTAAAAGSATASEPRRLVLKSSEPRWTRPAEPAWATEGDNRWYSENVESRRDPVDAPSTVSADVPWEYRDEPLTGASRWLLAEPEPKDAHVEAIIARLSATGLTREMAEAIATAVPKEHRRNGAAAFLERAVADHLSDLSAGEEGYAPVELFVGPPGAGKTTTIAKIASQERARRGARLSLVAADGFRVGAVEQLRIYADIIGAPFAVARTMPELERALLASRGTVLVDTAGRSVRDPRAQEVLALLAGIPGVRTHFVIAAATSVRDVNRMLDAYGKRRPNRVVLTRIDEADSISPLMQVFRDRGLKVSFLGVGQRVPEDLERATPQRIAAHVLGHGLPQGLPA